MKLKKLLAVLPDDEEIVINEWVPRGRCVRKDGNCDVCKLYKGETVGCALHADISDEKEMYDGIVALVPIRLACKTVCKVTAHGEDAVTSEKLIDKLEIQVMDNRG